MLLIVTAAVISQYESKIGIDACKVLGQANCRRNNRRWKTCTCRTCGPSWMEQDEVVPVDSVKLHVAAAVDPVDIVVMNTRHSLDHPLVIHHVFGRLLTHSFAVPNLALPVDANT